VIGLQFSASVSRPTLACKSLAFIDKTQSKSNEMNKLLTNRNLIIANFAIVSYFILIWLINFYKIDFVLIGVFREMLTIPFLIAQIVFLVIGIRYLMKNKRNPLIIISFLTLVICSVITIGSFF
jgi:hypothetical protein